MHNNTANVIYSLEVIPIDKFRRQAALLRLIRSQPVENQEQIVAMMLREGFRVTQASVSRDIREMGLVKLAGRYLSAKRALAKQPDGPRLELEVGLITGLEPVGANLVVVKTRVGAASSVAVVLDHELGETAAGTIAGDDTVFVAVRSRCDQGQVVARLNAWLRQTPPPGDDPGRRQIAPGRQIAKMAPTTKTRKPIGNGKTRGSLE
jgi:transcriptional regulator of arginine metabolism